MKNEHKRWAAALLTTAALLALSLYQALGTLEPSVLAEQLEVFRSELILEIHTQPLPEGLLVFPVY